MSFDDFEKEWERDVKKVKIAGAVIIFGFVVAFAAVVVGCGYAIKSCSDAGGPGAVMGDQIKDFKEASK